MSMMPTKAMDVDDSGGGLNYPRLFFEHVELMSPLST